MKIRTEINIEEKLWKSQPQISKKIKDLVKKIIPKTPLKNLSETIEISILLTSDSAIQELNKNYRCKNKPTNVLSFPMIDFSNFEAESDDLLLGDIAISYQRILEEAQEQGKTFDDHLTHLLVHSILHLIGFDHEIEADAQKMEALEIKILKEFGIENPYL